MTNFRSFRTDTVIMQTTISNFIQTADNSPIWVENDVGKGEIRWMNAILS